VCAVVCARFSVVQLFSYTDTLKKDTSLPGVGTVGVLEQDYRIRAIPSTPETFGRVEPCSVRQNAKLWVQLVRNGLKI
jgi:hypothetical protein